MIYVPNTCTTKKCRLHVSLHGCQQGMNFNNGWTKPWFYGDQYILNTGYLQWAAKNDIIVLMPQASNTGNNGINPLGCWEFFDFTTKDKWYTNQGSQTSAIKMMVDKVMGTKEVP